VSLAIEIGELLEHFQWRTEDEVGAYLDDPKNLERVEEEVADVLIYSLLLAHGLGADVPEIVRRKIRRNARKYPEETYRGRAHVGE
jgi:NTP pyrophosphatase (non-canonical NTP hydrolase)